MSMFVDVSMGMKLAILLSSQSVSLRFLIRISFCSFYYSHLLLHFLSFIFCYSCFIRVFYTFLKHSTVIP